jgi:diacylglycerol kinase family enzyme
MKLRLIVNPVASGVDDEVVERVRERLAAVADVDVAATTAAGDAQGLAAAAGADAVVALGGDGTANEVVNGLPAGLPAGFLPGGATSVFMRQLGFPNDPVEAASLLAASIAAGRTRPVGMGRLDGRRFTFAAGLGIDAEAMRIVHEQRAGHPQQTRPSDLRVVAAALRALRADGFTLPPRMTVAAGDRALRCGYLAVANAHPYTYFGARPLPIAPRAGFDTALDAVVVAGLRRRDLWRLPVYGLAWPRHATGRDARVTYLHDVGRLDVTCDEPVSAQIDGEFLGRVWSAELRYEPEAITAFVPPAWFPEPGSEGT